MCRAKRLLILALFLALSRSSFAQRFSQRLQEEEATEVDGLEEEGGGGGTAFGLSRLMTMAQASKWEIQSLALDEDAVDEKTRFHILKYLGKPFNMKLYQKSGKLGLVATAELQSGKKLRALWREGSIENQRESVDLLKASYDEAVESRMAAMEFEVLLPSRRKNGKKALPSVVLQVPIETGSLNTQVVVSRGSGTVRVNPQGRDGPSFFAGICMVGSAPCKPGIIDPNWARGRTVFRKGRSAGLL